MKPVKDIDVKDIVREYLEKYGYNGLRASHNCMCLIDDIFAHCYGMSGHCKPAYIREPRAHAQRHAEQNDKAIKTITKLMEEKKKPRTHMVMCPRCESTGIAADL